LIFFFTLNLISYLLQASFALEMLLKRAGANEEDSPNLARYINAMRERPAYKRAMEKVGKTSITN
jgi:glutathione S-transferase